MPFVFRAGGSSWAVNAASLVGVAWVAWLFRTASLPPIPVSVGATYVPSAIAFLSAAVIGLRSSLVPANAAASGWVVASIPLALVFGTILMESSLVPPAWRPLDLIGRISGDSNPSFVEQSRTFVYGEKLPDGACHLNLRAALKLGPKERLGGTRFKLVDANSCKFLVLRGTWTKRLIP